MKRFANLSLCACLALLGTLATGAAFGAAFGAPPKDIQLPTESAKLKPSKLAGYAVAQQKCAICHSADYVAYQPPGMNQTQWTAEMAKMQHTYGAPIDDNEIKLLGIYLAATYGDGKGISAADLALTAAPAAAATAVSAAVPPSGPVTTASASDIDVQALLTSNACLSCHALNQKIVGPGYHDVAAKYKADPDALTKLEASIKAGGVGKWGQVPMPPFAQLTDAQLKALASFVMKQ